MLARLLVTWVAGSRVAPGVQSSSCKPSILVCQGCSFWASDNIAVCGCTIVIFLLAGCVVRVVESVDTLLTAETCSCLFMAWNECLKNGSIAFNVGQPVLLLVTCWCCSCTYCCGLVLSLMYCKTEKFNERFIFNEFNELPQIVKVFRRKPACTLHALWWLKIIFVKSSSR